MDINERDRLAAAIIALRPDWACNGFDRLRTMRDWLSKNLMDWSFRDATVALTLVAIDPASNGPARLMTDGPWRTILRHVSSDSVTAKMPGYAQLEPECGYPGCGVRRDLHLAHVIPAEIPAHMWEQPRPVTRASTEQIRAAHEAAFTPPKES